MSSELDFDRLVHLFEYTHREMQHSAARSVDTALVVRNWLFGWYIVEYEQNGKDRASYGDRVILRLSERLKKILGRGFSARNLEMNRKFYLAYQQISQTTSAVLAQNLVGHENRWIPQRVSAESIGSEFSLVVDQLRQEFHLSWSHYVTLLPIDNVDERHFYEVEAAQNGWSVRELDRQIASSLYERLVLSRDKNEIRRLVHEGHIVEKAADLIKNPFVLEFLGLEEKPIWRESDLESAIIDHLEHFLLELGKGFLFEARQKRFTFDNDHFFVDLVFYNRLLRCYVLVDLKRDKLTHQDLGQMQMYVNYFDRHVKLDDELPTVGIILCHRKNDALVELALPAEANIFASQYQLFLPSKQELRDEVERAQAEHENKKG